MSSTEAHEDTRALMEQAQRELSHIKSRYLSITSFATRLEELTRGKPFRVWNFDVWQHMFGARDMVYVYLASWARALSKNGGFWGKLKGGGARELFAPKRKPERHVDVEATLVASSRRKAFEYLFPAAASAGRRPSHTDIDALKGRLDAVLRPVIEDRDEFRVHPYEKGGLGRATLLKLDDLGPVFERTEHTLNQLSLLVDSSQFAFPDEPGDDCTDLVLSVLFGGVDSLLEDSGVQEVLHRSTDRYFWEFRDSHLDAIHAAATSQEREYFNDPLELRSVGAEKAESG